MLVAVQFEKLLLGRGMYYMLVLAVLVVVD